MIILELKKAKLLVPDPTTMNQLIIIDIPYNAVIANNIKTKLTTDFAYSMLKA